MSAGAELVLFVTVLTALTPALGGYMTPEYLGKKIEKREVMLVVAGTLVPAVTILVPAALALVPGLSSVGNNGPRGFSEVLYAFTSVSANNGSAMGDLAIQNDFYN